MPALQAAVTLATPADVHAKLPDDRALHGQLFLILRGDAPGAHRALTLWTVRRERRLVGLIDVRGHAPVGAHAIRGAGMPPGASRARHARLAGERRGLARHRSARGLELVLQLLVLAAQPLPLGLRPSQIFAKPLDLARLILDDLLRVARRRIGGAPRHEPVMADSRKK